MPAAGRERIGARPRRREGPWRTRMSSSSRRPPPPGELCPPPPSAARAVAALPRGESVGDPGAGSVADLVEPLSDREAEVLRLLAQGLTNKDMAQTLMLSVRTVEAHRRSIYGKLGARARTEAALWAVKHGHGLPE